MLLSLMLVTLLMYCPATQINFKLFLDLFFIYYHIYEYMTLNIGANLRATIKLLLCDLEVKCLSHENSYFATQ